MQSAAVTVLIACGTAACGDARPVARAAPASAIARAGAPAIAPRIARRAAVAVTLLRVGGDTLARAALEPLPSPLVVQALDARGHPVGGIVVRWTVLAGEGRVRPTSDSTDRRGRASASWIPGASADPQVVAATMGGLAPVEFRIVVPVASFAIAPAGATLWPGESVALHTALADSAGHTLASAPAEWLATDSSVAAVTGDGTLEARRPGTARVVARIASRTSVAPVTVLPVVHGAVWAGDDGALGELRVYVHTSATIDSTDVLPSGTFTLRLGAPLSGSAEVVVAPRRGGTAPHHPSVLHVGGPRELSDLRIVLVPKRWTVTRGSYAGTRVDISPLAALAPAGDGGRFWRLTPESPAGTRALVGWPADSVPLTAAFRGRGAGITITPSDSVEFWDIVRGLEHDVGAPLFRPGQPVPDSVISGGIDVLIDPGTPSVGHTFVVWSSNGDLYDGTVSLHSRAALRDPSITSHELLHALGFGHTSSWRSVMSSHGSAIMRPTADDVAYVQVMLAVRRAQELHRALYGVAEAAEGERRAGSVVGLVAERPRR